MLLLCLLNVAMVIALGVGAVTAYSLSASLLVCALLGLSVVVWASLSPLSFFAPAALLQASAFLYVAPLALNRWVEGVLTQDRQDLISHGPVNRAVWLALLAAAIFSLAAAPWALAGSGQRSGPPRRLPPGTRVVALLLIVLGALCLAFLVYQLGGFERISRLSHGERYLAMRGKGLIRVGIDLLFLGGVLLYASLGRSAAWRRLLIVVLLLVAFGALFVVEQRRMAPFKLLITLVVLRHTIVRRIPKGAVIGLGLLVLGAGMFQGVFRGLSERSWKGLTEVPGVAFNLANSEFGYPTLTIADILDRVPRERDWLKGGSYLDSVGVLVPRAVWPGRPRPLGERYVAEFYTDYWRRGGGFGFTPVGEAYWNWGVLGVVGVFALLGLVAQLGERAVTSSLGQRPVPVICYALLAPFLIMFYRFDSASFLKGNLILILPLLVIVALLGALDRLKRSVFRAGGSELSARGTPGERC